MRTTPEVSPVSAGRRKPGRRSPKASVTLGRFTFLWLDLWDNRYGIDFEWEGPKWRYSFAVGFGHKIRLGRSPS